MSTQSTRPGAATIGTDFANTAKDKISDTLDDAQALAQEQYDKFAGTIRRNPLQAAGIAAGIGFVLALLARR